MAAEYLEGLVKIVTNYSEEQRLEVAGQFFQHLMGSLNPYIQSGMVSSESALSMLLFGARLGLNGRPATEKKALIDETFGMIENVPLETVYEQLETSSGMDEQAKNIFGIFKSIGNGCLNVFIGFIFLYACSDDKIPQDLMDKLNSILS